MRRILLTIAAVGLTVLPAFAVEVQLRDGTVIEAVEYTLTGSFLMLELADGRQVAYDLADVDIDAFKAQIAQTPEKAEASRSEPTLSEGRRQLSLPPADGETTKGMAITDHDVEHIRSGGDAEVSGEGEGEGSESTPEGYQTGGRVVISSLKVTAQGENRWLVEGEIVNRRPSAVLDVRVDLRTEPAAGTSPWTGSVSVTNQIEPNKKAVFQHTFKAAKPRDKPHPDVRASVIWTEHGEPGTEVPPAAHTAPRVAPAAAEEDITYQ